MAHAETSLSSDECSKSVAVVSESKGQEKQKDARTPDIDAPLAETGVVNEAPPKSMDSIKVVGRKSPSPSSSPLIAAAAIGKPFASISQKPSTNASTAASPLEQQPVPKKRKTNPALLADAHVVQITHDVLGLLQLYGPLSKAQLEYNLPPCRRSLQDILELLVASGVVRIVDNGVGSSELLYSTFSTTRHDVILPQQVLPALESAHAEYRASLKRGDLLKEYLQNYSPSSPTPRALLQKLLMEFPDIRNDPVYVAAMRNVGVVDAQHGASKSSRK